jgi:hypothetical protein
MWQKLDEIQEPLRYLMAVILLALRLYISVCNKEIYRINGTRKS